MKAILSFIFCLVGLTVSAQMSFGPGVAMAQSPPAAGGGGGGDPAFVQGGGATIDNSRNFDKAFSSEVTSGNKLIIAVSMDAASATVMSTTNVLKVAGTATIGSASLDRVYETSTRHLAIWSVPITGSGTLTVRVMVDTACYGGVGIAECSNISTADGAGATGHNTTGAPATAAFNTSAKGVIFGALLTVCTAPTTHTPSADYQTLCEEEDGENHATFSIVYRVTTGALTGETTDWTAPDFLEWYATAVGYK